MNMCWATLAHPSAPLVAAGIATAESLGEGGRAVLEGYVVGFEVEAVLGSAMNPSHYEQGWHCTSTLGTIGSAATAARVLGLGYEATSRALSIAASEASGLKENFGTMVKPLHAGLAARNGVVAAFLARAGLTASKRAIDGPQGFLVAMNSDARDLDTPLAALGQRWEIIDGGITVKLYPSCAATHPTIDTLIDLRRDCDLDANSIAAVEIGVDRITPTVLIYDRPTSGLEAKFSPPLLCRGGPGAWPRGHRHVRAFGHARSLGAAAHSARDDACRRRTCRSLAAVDPGARSGRIVRRS